MMPSIAMPCRICTLLDVSDSHDESVWTRILGLFKAAAKEFSSDRCSRMAAAIAYRTVFALTPLLLIAISVASLFLDDPASDCDAAVDNCRTIQQQLTDQVSLISEELAATVEGILAGVAETSGRNGAIGSALFLFTASSLFFEIQGSLNTIFHAPEHHLRGMIAQARGRSVGALAVLVLGALIVVLLAANTFVSSAGSLLVDFLERVGLNPDFFAPLISIAGPLVSFGLLVLVFAVQFQAFPAVRVPWKAAWRGGAVTAVAFVVGALGLGWVLGSDRLNFDATGFASSVVLLLFLVFVLSQIYLFGAEFTKTYVDYIHHGDIQQPSVRRSYVSPEITDEMVKSAATTELIAKVGVFSFVAGLLLGWFRRD